MNKISILEKYNNTSKVKIPFDSSLPLTWYPIGLSKDLKKQKHMNFNMFGEDWIAFRTKKGALGATSRFCCHVGTDLSNGKVVNECIECPLHGWQFNTDGVCKHIPVQKDIPKKAVLKTLLVQEHFGIIFVFNKKAALFEFQEICGEVKNLQYSSTKVVPIDAPACIVALNTFDTQHYKKVHARDFVKPPELSQSSPYSLKINYTAKVIKQRWVDYVIDNLVSNEITVSIEAWGGNLLFLRNENTQYSCIVSVKPISDMKSIIFITALKDKDNNNSTFIRFADKIMLEFAVSLLKSYLSPDIDIIENTRPINGVLLNEADAALKQFFTYWETLPKSPLGVSSNV